MVQDDGKQHKEDVERWCRAMVNYIKKLCGDEMVQGDGKLHKKMWRDGIGQGDGKLHKEDVERWYRAMVNYLKKMGRDGVERW